MMDLPTLLGEDVLDRLASIAGGTKLFIPKHYGKPPGGGRDTSERLIKLVGPELAILLVFHFGDSSIYIPSRRASTRVDARRLRRLERQGLSARAIAIILGCSERTIVKHRQRGRTTSAIKTRKGDANV
jgi:hypothetical protein